MNPNQGTAMKELKPGMKLTAGGRTWEIIRVGTLVIIKSGHEYASLYLDLAAMLPWEEPVGEWVTDEQLRDLGECWSFAKWAEVLNAFLTRKYGQPPKEVRDQ